MILQALKEYYDRKAAETDSGIAPLGWEWKPIPFVINLSRSGELIRIEDTRDGKNAKPFLVPILGESKGNGVKSNFPWENAEYIFGIPLKEDKNGVVPKRKEEFKTRLDEYLSEDWASAILTFLQNSNTETISTLFPTEWAQILKGAYILFAIEGVPVSDLDSFKQCYRLPSGLQRICLATGMRDTIKEKEPPVKGGGFFKTTPNGNIKSELHIVSFNEEAFTSFGKKQGYNAPIGQTTSFAYTNALNYLLRFGSRQKMQVGDATTVFWSSEKNVLEDEFADIFGEPQKDDPDRHIDAVERLLASVRTGAYAHEAGTARFYVLGLSPNAARIAVRFWHEGTVAEMEKRFADWFESLRIVHGPKDREHLSLTQLLLSVTPHNNDYQKWKSNIPPNLAGAVMRSILDGTSLPASLLPAAIVRIKAERDITYPRAKLIKAFLIRNYERNLTMSLDKDNTNVGYRLGRLFSVLEKIQQAAINPTATIRDRFYPSASATPAAVFGNLMRLAGHHLSKLDSDKKGLRIWFEKQLEEIMSGIPKFPAHLSLEDQGMFAIGYYHQRCSKKGDETNEATSTTETV